MSEELVSPLLAALQIPHGFGTRHSTPPDGLLRPIQVHKAGVVVGRLADDSNHTEADAIVTGGSSPVGVVTADCVPVLVATRSGSAAVAIHGGWRGLAAGVVEAGVAALRAQMPKAELIAAIGPHVGPCCYEVDEPVLQGLEALDPEVRAVATRPSRPGHVWLDLGALTERALGRAQIRDIDSSQAHCTACDTTRFFSVRKEGAGTGRLIHWIGVAD